MTLLFETWDSVCLWELTVAESFSSSDEAGLADESWKPF